MLISLLIAIITFYGTYLWIIGRKYSHLPGYLGNEFPIIGHLYYSLKSSFLTHDDLIAYLKQQLPPGGGISTLWSYCKPVVAVSDPILIEKLAGHPAFCDKEPLVYENISNFWKGTFTYAYSDTKWKQRRKIINHSMNNQNLINYHNTFVKIAKRMVDKMEHESGAFNIERYTSMATMDSVIETHFGCDLNMIENNELYKIVHWGMSKVAKTFINPVYGFFLNIYLFFSILTKPFHQIIETSLKNTREKRQKATEDMTKNLYLEAMLEQYPSIDKNYKEIQQELMEMLFVGSQPVSILVSTALVFLATLPELQEKAWQEQQNIFGDSDRDPTIMDLKNMEYLERVVKEVIRFISGPTLARRTKEEIIIDGKIIPPKTTVILCSRIMLMDNYYWENPTMFNPDRYLGNEPSKSYNHAMSAFGYGIRNCPGSQFTYIQGKVLLSTVLRAFKVVSDRRYEDIKQSAQLMMEIKEGKNISIVKRKM
ncbi:cytochrome P450 4c3 [Halyomorpha halys]|uniref:cytochrome P450 4c3 n=1 Tax=Halyomorpha halys TaxID=286706 RepID=UPI0006D4E104|nr:cytochrome P450 4c3-like [Halyomorpha halys]